MLLSLNNLFYSYKVKVIYFFSFYSLIYPRWRFLLYLTLYAIISHYSTLANIFLLIQPMNQQKLWELLLHTFSIFL